MTSCVAGLCKTSRAIVAAMDAKVSISGWTSGEAGLVKFERIHPAWFALYSGSSLVNIDPIVRRATERIGQEGIPNDVDRISDLFSASYQEQRVIEANRRILSIYSLNMERFLERGKRIFNSYEFTDINRKINEIDMECEFLIAGLDSEKKAHIFTVRNPGIVEHYDQLGYWAIGSGSSLAIASLITHAYPAAASIPLAVYRVLSAKFSSEFASDVGKDTLVIVMESDLEPKILSDETVSKLRAIWDKEGKPRIPQNIESRAQDVFSYNKPDKPSANPSSPSSIAP